jgi:hypothetical protein
LVPPGEPTSDRWICSCILWEREFGDVKVDAGEGHVDWDDDEMKVEEGDAILAEKLHAEWRGKGGR